MRSAVLLALVACSSGSETKPPPPAASSVRFVGCQLAPAPPSRPLPPQPDAPGEGKLGDGPGIGLRGGSGSGMLGHGAGPGRLHGHGARAPHVRLNKPVVTGSLDASLIRRQFRRVGPRLQSCYEHELAAKPTLGGVVTIKLTIGGTGKVSTAEASGVDPELATCVGEAIRAIDFPKPPDGLAVQVTEEIAFKLDETRELPWTPYAVHATADDPAARASVSAEVERVHSEIDACFGGSKGALRAMIGVEQMGRVRTGGLGDPRIEDCVAKALRAAHIPPASIEVACDFESGGPAPWRISPTGYQRISPGASTDDPPNADASYLIVADRDTTGDKIDELATWAAPAVVVAVAVASDSGAPIFVGLAPSAQLPVETAPSIGLTAKAGSIATCDGKDPAKIADPHALDTRFAALHTPVAFALTPEVTAKELVGLTSAAIRAKLPYRLGGACP